MAIRGPLTGVSGWNISLAGCAMGPPTSVVREQGLPNLPKAAPTPPGSLSTVSSRMDAAARCGAGGGRWGHIESELQFWREVDLAEPRLCVGTFSPFSEKKHIFEAPETCRRPYMWVEFFAETSTESKALGLHDNGVRLETGES